MRAARSFLLLTAALGLAGCDRLTGAAEQKILDAEAVGYACRVSLKTPEDCMKENESHSPTSVLAGWKAADKAVKEGTLDPSMGKNAAAHAPLVPAAAPAEAPAATQPAASAPAATPVAGAKPAATEKPAEKTAPAAPATDAHKPAH